MIKQKKAQIEIQETAFVMLAIIILAAIMLLFFVRIQSTSLKSSANELKEQEVVSNLMTISAMPEISCSETFSSELKSGVKGLCVDEDKLMEFTKYSQSYKWQGISRIEIKRVYPKTAGECISKMQEGNCESYILFDNGKSSVGMASFVNLCRQSLQGYNCHIAKLIVSTEEV